MTKTFFGTGAIEQLEDIVREVGARTILLVHGKESFRASGAEAALKKIFSSHSVVEYSDFVSNPTLKNIEHGVELARKHGVDLVVAIGGGSAIDVGKSIAATALHKEPLLDFLEKRASFEMDGIPVVAIPTTAGTGSEVTQFVALYSGKTKKSLDHPSLSPRYAIVDADLTRSLSPYLTASTGMDALSQAIESYWSIHSTLESKKYAREAIALAFANLPEAVKSGTPGSRLFMSKAAHLAGKAIDITRTTACHAISYPITAHFGVAHGHAVSLTLPGMIEYNGGVDAGDVADVRGHKYVRKTLREIAHLLGARDVFEARQNIIALLDAVGLERCLSRLGIAGETHLERIIKNSFAPERMKNNPRIVTADSLGAILREIH